MNKRHGAASVAALLLAATPAAAQTAGQDWSVSLTPYIWIAGISGTIDTTDRDSSVPVGADFGDLLSNLSGFAFMGAAEVRYQRFGLLGDIMTLSVESDIDTPRGRLFSGGTGRVSTTIGSLIGLYRVVDDPSSALDIGAGVRFWNLSSRLTLDAAVLSERSVKTRTSWTDPVLAVRYGLQLSPTWGLSFYGDIGGFGAGSELTWQVMATANYRVSESIDLRVGYRHLAVDRRSGDTQTDISLSGPIVGATLRF